MFNVCPNRRKISRYSPSEAAKIYEKAVQRHPVPTFHPKATIEIISEERTSDIPLTLDEKSLLLDRYLEVSSLYGWGRLMQPINQFSLILVTKVQTIDAED